jgi:4-hydroxythreonine-4-phosphate dehydrogenase
LTAKNREANIPEYSLEYAAQKMKIGITMGDPAGIGPEIVLRSLSQLQQKREDYSALHETVLIGAPAIIEETKERYSIQWEGEVIDSGNIDRRNVEYGKVSKLAGQASYDSVLKAHELTTSGYLSAMVTAPICKASVNLVHPAFSGHTELLANLTNTSKYAMMLAGSATRTVLVTTHVSIAHVASKLNETDILTKIELTDEFLRRDLAVGSPRIAVCALNPHAGEGIFGDEEERMISPAIEKARARGINANGPHPADTVFVNSDNFDAIVAMYHDQGMIPIKIKEFGTAVNVTLGLPYIRTSPDHGTAFDIAGKGAANLSSMIRAIEFAGELVDGRS